MPQILIMGDHMQKKKSYNHRFRSVAKPGSDVIRDIVKDEIKKVLERNNVTVLDLDEFVSNFVTELDSGERIELK